MKNTVLGSDMRNAIMIVITTCECIFIIIIVMAVAWIQLYSIFIIMMVVWHRAGQVAQIANGKDPMGGENFET